MGPVPQTRPPEVLHARAERLVGHLDPYFLAVMDETMANFVVSLERIITTRLVF